MEKKTIAELAKEIKEKKIGGNKYHTNIVVSDDKETTTLYIVSQYGNGVALTYDTGTDYEENEELGENKLVSADDIYRVQTLGSITISQLRDLFEFVGLRLILYVK